MSSQQEKPKDKRVENESSTHGSHMIRLKDHKITITIPCNHDLKDTGLIYIIYIRWEPTDKLEKAPQALILIVFA